MGVRLPQTAPPALELRRPPAWWHIARVNPLREVTRDSLVRPISKQERCAPARERTSWFPALGIRKSWHPTGAATVAPCTSSRCTLFLPSGQEWKERTYSRTVKKTSWRLQIV